jgi:hypothetical protein
MTMDRGVEADLALYIYIYIYIYKICKIIVHIIEGRAEDVGGAEANVRMSVSIPAVMGCIYRAQQPISCWGGSRTFIPQHILCTEYKRI